MVRYRVRLRFQKDGDLRFLGHRDLMNYLLRLLKVAKIKVANSQGFHPKPKVSFPSALPLGVEGFNEIMELETAIEYNAVELQDSLNACSANGLRFHSAENLPETGRKKPRPVSYTWRFPIPSGKRKEVQELAAKIQSGELGCENKDVKSAVLEMSVVTQFSSVEFENIDNSRENPSSEDDEPLIKEDFLRFTLLADENQGAVTYKDILALTRLTPVPETAGPAAGLTPMLRGAREEVTLGMA